MEIKVGVHVIYGEWFNSGSILTKLIGSSLPYTLDSTSNSFSSKPPT